MKISKTDYEALPAGMKKAFTAIEGTDEYTNGEEDAASLKTALAKEKEAKVKAAKERDEAKKLADEAAAKKTEEEEAAARKSGDFAKIEEGYKKKIADLEQSNQTEIAARDAEVARLASEGVVGDLTKLFVSPVAMKPYIQTRVKTEFVEGKAVTRVLDADGNPTASSIDDLKKEILATKEFSGILVASKGSGSGATRPDEGGGSTSGDKKFDAANAEPSDLVARLEAKGVGEEED